MTSNSSLLTTIRASLGSSLTPSLSTTSSTSDVFEAYVFSIVLEAANIEGATITFQDVFGNTPSMFYFRTSPGYIFSTIQPYTHAVIQFPNKPVLEAHMGVRVTGKSGVLHECDVSVLHQSEATTCRNNFVSPRSSKLVMAIECKFYSTSIPLGLARAFIGLQTDLSAQESFFVVNTNSASVEKLLAKRDRYCGIDIIPSSPVTVDKLRSAFQNEFSRYKIIS